MTVTKFYDFATAQAKVFASYSYPPGSVDEFTHTLDTTGREVLIYVEGEWITLVEFSLKYRTLRDGSKS